MMLIVILLIVVLQGGHGAVLTTCTINTCRNGGSCVLEGKTYRCICPAGWKGVNCEQTVDPITTRATGINTCPYHECPVNSPELCRFTNGTIFPNGNYVWPQHPNGFMPCIGGKPWDCQCCPNGLVWVPSCNECHGRNDPSLCTTQVTTTAAPTICTIEIHVCSSQSPPATTTVGIYLRAKIWTIKQFGTVTFNAGDVHTFNVPYDPVTGVPHGADIHLDTLQVELCIDKILVTLANGITYIVKDGQSNNNPGPRSRGFWISTFDTVYVPPPTGMQTYKCIIFTGNQANAGTTANIFVILVGEIGRSETMTLSGSKNNSLALQRGQLDDFMFTIPDIGPICSIEIWSDGIGSSPNWFIQTVFIMLGNEFRMRVFQINRWVTKNRFIGQGHMTIECNGCENTVGLCTGLPDGDYTYPNEVYKYVSCCEGRPSLRSCPKPTVWVQVSPGVGRCDWST